MNLFYTSGSEWLNSHDDQNLSKWFLNKLILSAITTSFGKLFQIETTLLVK